MEEDIPLALTGNTVYDDFVQAVVRAEVKALTERLQTLHHGLEHSLVRVQDAIQSSIVKLREREDSTENRIDAVCLKGCCAWAQFALV